MDVNPQYQHQHHQQDGYMDVSVEANAASAGYMDVQPQAGANNQDAEESDEEV
jgi:hypothetical protein